jgi:O-glycosyl hydrolase
MLFNTVYVKQGPFYVQEAWDKQWNNFAVEMGGSMARFEIPPTFLPSDGAAYNPAGNVFGMGSTRNNWTHARALIARGCTRFIGTVWSPPCYMKYSRTCEQGNVLDIAFRDKYATFIADFVKMWKDSTGIELYGLSYANEPQFTEPYNSCIWNPPELNDIITRTAPLLTARNVSPKIYAAEHMFWAGASYYSPLLDNANLHAFAVHGYSDGISPDYGTATDWENLYSSCNAKDKKVWMTETTCDADFLTVAKNLHTAFNSGRVSAWTWWAYGDNVLQSGTSDPKDCFHATRHYARFVRPGAVCKQSSSTQTGLWVTAYRNDDGTYAIVLVNTNSGSTTVDLAGADLPTQWLKYVSAGSNRVQNQGSTGNTGISIAGSSVTTLYSGSDVTSVEWTTQAKAAARALSNGAVAARVFTIDGRLVGTVQSRELAVVRSTLQLARGSYYVRLLDSHGATVRVDRLSVQR